MKKSELIQIIRETVQKIKEELVRPDYAHYNIPEEDRKKIMSYISKALHNAVGTHFYNVRIINFDKKFTHAIYGLTWAPEDIERIQKIKKELYKSGAMHIKVEKHGYSRVILFNAEKMK